MNPESPSFEFAWSPRRWNKLRRTKPGPSGRPDRLQPRLPAPAEAPLQKRNGRQSIRPCARSAYTPGAPHRPRSGKGRTVWVPRGRRLQDRRRSGNVDHLAFDPRRIRRRDQESGFAQVDPDMLARTEVFAVSRHDFPQAGNPGRKYLNTGYRKRQFF